jgi:hypothetical protein
MSYEEATGRAAAPGAEEKAMLIERAGRAHRGALALTALMALAALGASGCVNAVTVQIGHPLTRGGVPQNRIVQADEDRASYLGLPPNTFRNEASLVALDAQRACFALSLRIDGDHANLANPADWRVYLRGDPNIENTEPVFGPPAAQQVTPMAGSIPRQQLAGYTTNCTRIGSGVRCSQNPRYVTVRYPATINVVSGGGTVCFVHGGSVNRATEQLTLHMDDPNNALHRLAFRWRFIP